MKIKAFLLVVLAFVLVFALTACGSKDTATPTPTPSPENTTSSEANDSEDAPEAIEFDPNDKTDWPKSVRMGTGSIGGTYFIYGGGWGEIVYERTGVDVSVEVTGGPVHNMQLVQAKELELGNITMGPGFDGWNGLADWSGGDEMRDMRVMFPEYTTYFHWWATENSGIESIYDLKGNVGVGPSGGTPGTYLPEFLTLLGVEDVNPVFAGIGDLSSQVLDGVLPATGFAAGIPFAAAVEAEAQRDMNLFGFSEEDVEKIVKEYPFFSPSLIPAGTYTSKEEDMHTVGIWNMAIGHKDLPDSFVYNIVDAVMNSNERMLQVHSASNETLPENIKYNTFMHMHPGAIRWFEENGYELADEVYPDDYPKK